MNLTLALNVFEVNEAEWLAVQPLLLGSLNTMVGYPLIIYLVYATKDEARQIDLNSVIHTDGWHGYHCLVDVGYAKHFRVEHGKKNLLMANCILTVLSPFGFILNLN